MPRTSARVVCTLCVTIDTFEPTSALSSVDLPALGAPISATNPARVTGAEVIWQGRRTHDPLLLRERAPLRLVEGVERGAYDLASEANRRAPPLPVGSTPPSPLRRKARLALLAFALMLRPDAFAPEHDSAASCSASRLSRPCRAPARRCRPRPRSRTPARGRDPSAGSRGRRACRSRAGAPIPAARSWRRAAARSSVPCRGPQ